MALSTKKQAKLENERRRDAVAKRSLDGKGYFMDAGHEMTVREYLSTGDDSLLERLPDYRKIRAGESGR